MSEVQASSELSEAIRRWLQSNPHTASAPRPERDAVAELAETVLAPALSSVPGVSVEVGAFIEHVARCIGDSAPVDALAGLRAVDLWLAWCCAQGDAAALRRFDELFGNELAATARRLRADDDTRKELMQQSHAALCAPPEPKLLRYAGQGDLRNFLRVVLVRKMIDFRRRQRAKQGRELPIGADDNEVPTPGDDVELAYLKRTYGGAFRQAFEQAATELSAEQRNLLRHHYSDGLNVDALGRRYGVHRATAARRVARARQELLAGTRRHLMQTLKLNPQQLDSVLRLIESNVHVSVKRILAAPRRAAGDE